MKKRIVLITGCSSGLGNFLAKALYENGYIVYAGVQKKFFAEQSEEKMKSLNGIHYIPLDITDNKDCEQAIQTIIEKEDRIDILINNAGMTISGPITDFSEDKFEKLLDTNVIGAFRLITKVIPYMKRNKKGHIINITSLNGSLALPNFSLYCASKFAIEGLGTALYYELYKDNIHITNIAPGAILQPLKKTVLSHTPAREKFLLLKLLMPMVTYEVIAKQLLHTLIDTSPSRFIPIGRDAKITLLLQRYLPNILWGKIMLYIWNK